MEAVRTVTSIMGKPILRERKILSKTLQYTAIMTECAKRKLFANKSDLNSHGWIQDFQRCVCVAVQLRRCFCEKGPGSI